MDRDAEHGPSFACAELPDICFWKVMGDLSAADVHRMYAVQRQFAKGKRYILVLVDLSGLRSASAGARRAGSMEPRDDDVPVRGVATFGASFHFRVIAQAVARVQRLLYTKMDNPAYFCKTEAQARAWLDARRAVLRNEFANPAHP